MSWSIPIGRLFGSEIKVHVTFFLLLAWIGFDHYQVGGTPAAIQGMLFIVAIFACVVAHEFGHALAARRYGIRTPDITLLPIGGLARLERMPEKPGQEIVVALAGPAVNVVIAAGLLAFLSAGLHLSALDRLGDPGVSFVARIASVNIFLVLFNLIPAFPMDGGRVLRASLSFWFARRRATLVAARVGQVIAIGFAVLALYGNTMLLFVAVFVFLAATAEARAAGAGAAVRRLGVADAMVGRFQGLRSAATIERAADVMRRSNQDELPVVDDEDRPRGMLTRTALGEAMRFAPPSTPVDSVMTTGVPTVPLGTSLAAALRHLQDGALPAVGVVDGDGRLVGYLTPAGAARAMAAARDGDGPAARRRPVVPQ